jgi:hypothetical protein
VRKNLWAWLGLILAALWLCCPSAWAQEEVLVRGRVMDAGGAGLAGTLVSDGYSVIKTGRDGVFSLKSRPGRVVCLSAPSGYEPSSPWWWAAEDAAREDLNINLRQGRGKKGLPLIFMADLHLYDPHAPPSRSVPRERADLPMQVWRRLAEELSRSPAALIVAAGDLCADADYQKAAGAQAQLTLAARALKMLPGPVRALPGNHDVLYRGPQGPQVYLDLWRKHLGPARQVFLLNQAAIILWDNLGLEMDHRGKTRSCGRTSPQALSWLKELLALIPIEKPLILVSHYPLLSPLAGSNPLWGRALVKAPSRSGLGLRNSDLSAQGVISLLSGRRVLALVNGHEHAFYESSLHLEAGDLRVVGLPAVCGGWWKGSRRWGRNWFSAGYVLGQIKPGPTLETQIKEVRLEVR